MWYLVLLVAPWLSNVFLFLPVQDQWRVVDMDQLWPLSGAGARAWEEQRVQDFHSSRLCSKNSSLGTVWVQRKGIQSLGSKIPAEEQSERHLWVLRLGWGSPKSRLAGCWVLISISSLTPIFWIYSPRFFWCFVLRRRVKSSFNPFLLFLGLLGWKYL